MRALFSFICLFAVTTFVNGQAVEKRLADMVMHFEADKQMRSGVIGFYVIDQKSGAVIFEKNADMGLAVASSQKVITSIAALEMLGTEYRFKTELGYEGTVINGTLNGNIYLVGHGDPTLG